MAGILLVSAVAVLLPAACGFGGIYLAGAAMISAFLLVYAAEVVRQRERRLQRVLQWVMLAVMLAAALDARLVR